MLQGRWTYRGYRNRQALVDGDAPAALALIFGEGVLDLTVQEGGRLGGGLGFSTGAALALEGELLDGDPAGFALVGLGLAGTPTEGWRYDYRGVVGHPWPGAVDQVPSLLGTVVRVNAHGPSAPAGVTASFVAVRHSDDPPPRMLRRSSLTVGLVPHSDDD
jgi:hypothetical protein